MNNNTSSTMDDTNKLEEDNAQGVSETNNNESNNNNEEGIDETDNQCQLWSTTQPSSDQPSNSNSNNPTSNNQTTPPPTTDNSTFGDIWSTEAFSYYTSYKSPLKTLLDSNSYTLNQLLAQDELLQELRGCEVKLINYFNKEDVVAELLQVLLVDVPHEIMVHDGKDGIEDGKERWIKQEIERRAANKLQKEKQDKEQEKKSYAEAVESPENKLQQQEKGLTFDASSPNQPSNATLDINTPNGNSPTFLPSPNDNEEELGNNEELEKDEEVLSPLGMLFILVLCLCNFFRRVTPFLIFFSPL